MKGQNFYDVDHDKFYTIDELVMDYNERFELGEIDREIYDTFGYYLESCMTYNGGSLREI